MYLLFLLAFPESPVFQALQGALFFLSVLFLRAGQFYLVTPVHHKHFQWQYYSLLNSSYCYSERYKPWNTKTTFWLNKLFNQLLVKLFALTASNTPKHGFNGVFLFHSFLVLTVLSSHLIPELHRFQVDHQDRWPRTEAAEAFHAPK